MKTTDTGDTGTKRTMLVGDEQAICEACLRTLTSVTEFYRLLLDRRASCDIRQDIEIVNSEAQYAARMVRNLLNPVRKLSSAKQLEITCGGS